MVTIYRTLRFAMTMYDMQVNLCSLITVIYKLTAESQNAKYGFQKCHFTCRECK